jgi:hypothetical protein
MLEASSASYGKVTAYMPVVDLLKGVSPDRVGAYQELTGTGAPERYHQAIGLAAELGMRPLVAHCHLGLGKLYRRTGRRHDAREHLTTATTMYHEMGMTYWLEEVQRELTELKSNVRALWHLKMSGLAFLDQMAHDFGGVVRFTVPGRTIYLVSEPLAARHILVTNVANYAKGPGQREAARLVGEGLLTADSIAWPRQRRALETLFNPARMGDLARSVGSAVERLDARWARCTREGTTTEPIRDVKELRSTSSTNFSRRAA